MLCLHKASVFSKIFFGASSGIRTHTLQGLSLLTLPIGLYSHGALPRIRTETLRLLRPLSLPIGVGGQNKYHMEQNYVEDLYDVARKQPYKSTLSHSTVKEFTSSFPKRQAYDFIPLELKQIGAPTKN